MRVPTPSARRRALIAVAAAAGLALPVAAQAQVLFVRDHAVWAMADDGGDQHQVLHPDEVATPGWRLSRPAVSPTGTAFAFEGTWGQVRTGGGPIGACGDFCTGVYAWDAGRVRRLSEAPVFIPFQEAFDGHPHMTPDGRVTSRFELYGWETTITAPFWRYIADEAVDRVTAADGSGRATLGDLGGACRRRIGFPAPTDAAVVPHPVAPDVYLYVGCHDGAQWPIVVSDAAGAAPQRIGQDDVSPSDPAFAPDGTLVVDVEGGTDPGIWSYRYPNPSSTGT